MKKTIDGELYDSESAEKIASFAKEFGADEFRHVEESLYMARNGRFFLAGGGGPMSRYVHPAGDRQVGGSDVVLLTSREARKWCAAHGVDSETIKKLFLRQAGPSH